MHLLLEVARFGTRFDDTKNITSETGNLSTARVLIGLPPSGSEWIIVESAGCRIIDSGTLMYQVLSIFLGGKTRFTKPLSGHVHPGGITIPPLWPATGAVSELNTALMGGTGKGTLG